MCKGTNNINEFLGEEKNLIAELTNGTLSSSYNMIILYFILAAELLITNLNPGIYNIHKYHFLF